RTTISNYVKFCNDIQHFCGKSNLAKAMKFMKWFMINSSKETQSTEPIGVEPFALSTETETQPSLFEIVFILDDKTYRYGFKASQKNIVSQWLFYVPKKTQTRLFERDYQKFNISKNFQGEDIQSKTRENALFISVAAQFNKVGTRKLRKKFLIVCEGKETEPNYFKSFPVPKDVIDVQGFGFNPR
ncbi:AAA family ATPase, partial [Umezakia ovalisporum]|uniref:AAA family ATPase n=1 Tax=Umezakia ovalisporum TaxID=75695 RepID=UPI0039C66C7B